MIQIRSFIPTAGWERTTWTFLDDRLSIKLSSLTRSLEKELPYADVKEICVSKAADLRWLWAAFVLSLAPLWLQLPFCFKCMTNPAFELAARFLSLVMIALLIPCFHLHE